MWNYIQHIVVGAIAIGGATALGAVHVLTGAEVLTVYMSTLTGAGVVAGVAASQAKGS